MKKVPDGKLIPRIVKDKIQRRVRRMAEQIAYDYRKTSCVIVPVMTGGLTLCADLIRNIGESVDDRDKTARELVLLPLDAGSYGSEHVSGDVRLAKPKWDVSHLTGQDVLICDDIVDSGKTLRVVHEFIALAKPSSIALVAMIEKDVKRLPLPTLKKYEVGFRTSDFWAVGYGLDQDGFFRGLPNICEYVEKGKSEKDGFWYEAGGPM